MIIYKKIEFNSIDDIIINFDNIQKEDLFIGITKLLTNNINSNTFLAYETNITNISDIISDKFKLIFKSDEQENITCRFKKSIQTPLLIICLMSGKDTFYLEEIKEELILRNINIIYNFRIQPTNISEQCEVKENGNYISFVYPMILNYTLYDVLDIDLYLKNFRDIDILLNPDSEKLTCFNLERRIKRCIVPKSHFDGKEDGFYPILSFNYLKNITVSYQLSPIQIILPKVNDTIAIILKIDNNKDEIKIGQKGILYLITNFNDKNNIFKDTYVYFNSTIVDENKYKYNVNCKLWIPKNEKSRIICKLNENLIYKHQNILLNKVEFIYNNYNIIIFQQEFFGVEQLNYDIPFLYSTQQNIEIKEEKESYNLKFFFENFNDEMLYIYGERNNSIIIDKCQKNDNELNCEISKEKLEEILIKNNEQFKIGAINDTIGIINFNSISNINISYEIDNKEDIYVEITDLLSSYSQEGTPIAFKTNITNIPSINSDIYELCYFKKNKDSPLLYLCNFSRGKSSFVIDDELIMNNSHYKYNFRIQPFKKTYYFDIYDYGTSINLVYPEILNFTSEESLIIELLISDPSLANNLKLVSDSDYLKCEDVNGLKKCIVPLSHILGKQSGYYYLTQINRDESFIHYESSLIKAIFPENILEIFVNDENNNEPILVGKSGFLSFITNYTDEKDIFDISDIEEKTHFNTTISLSNVQEINVNVTCRLWKPKSDNLRLLCKLNEEIADSRFKLNSALFYYKKYAIALISMMSFKTIVTKTGQNIPFLYSDKQEINIEEDKQYYELKFKIEEYNNEVLFLQRKENSEDMYLTELILDNCNSKGKELICQIEKEKIIENLHYNGEIFLLDFYHLTTLLKKFSCVLDITVNYNNIKKEDVFVGVTTLLQNNLDRMSYIPYETNITSISNVNTDFFYFNTSIDLYYCKMKKSTNKPLLFICLNNNNIKPRSSLGENKTEVILNNIHIKYNFRIQPVNRPEEFTMKNEGSRIIIRYPTKLDFNKTDLIPIYFMMYKPQNTRGLRLNPDSEELDCGHSYNSMKRCLVPKSHFDLRKSGYFYIYYLNDENRLNIFYDISPVFVNLPKKDELIISIRKEDNKNIIKIGNKGTMALITDYYDNDNIFDSSDIEENTKFKAQFSGYKKYEANCRLWKIKNKNIRMICKFNENLERGDIKLSRVNSEYKGKKFYIYSDDNLKIEQLNSNISFLYSDKQEINIEDNKDSYEIIFKKDTYYNESLMLFKNKMKMINLECNEQENQIICSIKKDKLLELLSFNGENYYLGLIKDSIGLYIFDSVLDISINYKNIEKKDIHLNIKKLLTQFAEKNNFIVYETNITDINKISTDYFNLTTEKNDNLECLLKKNDEKLLLLCNALIPGKGSLGEIKEINLDKINIFYNFIIVNSKNEEEYIISDIEGTIISLIYPEELYFNVTDSYIIRYVTDYPEKLKDIKLNIEASEPLNCEDKTGLKECIVSKNHFNKEGYYYTYYNNSLGNTSIAYEASTVKIILQQSDKSDDSSNKNKLIGIIVGCSVGGLIVIGLIIFFVVRHHKIKKKINIDKVSGKVEPILSFSNNV